MDMRRDKEEEKLSVSLWNFSLLSRLRETNRHPGPGDEHRKLGRP
jgi:hypothetical protein